MPHARAIAGLTAGWLALVVLLIDETDEGFANVYSTAVSIQNLAPRANQRWLVIGICAVVLVVAWLIPLAQYESFLLLIGSAFVPLLGVLAAGYFGCRPRTGPGSAEPADAVVARGFLVWWWGGGGGWRRIVDLGIRRSAPIPAVSGIRRASWPGARAGRVAASFPSPSCALPAVASACAERQPSFTVVYASW